MKLGYEIYYSLLYVQVIKCVYGYFSIVCGIIVRFGIF